VAYAFQNREAYIQERQAERVNERGREFLALRLMTCIAQTFHRGESPLSAVELSKRLNITSRLVCDVLAALVRAGLLVEVSGSDVGYTPARPLRKITAYEVLSALRAGQGVEPTTREDDTRMTVRAEFEKITEAERQAGSASLDQLLRGESDGGRAAAV
jgi:membrane protein